ncbi:cob(I)yrinic acid a,c-diamide adenosyltransferase [Clostridium sp. YIM B02515]|uniref:Cob(I)yrinic acid a,c-diamide adenosyltransferase n=1 Tax=Clostridium rhizosphaerae TaxID=2803861 RepID=A0ABS1TAR2_9CLOT|nr:cob(I)yrinic acid a,c-diamide adenosyltransferase [Clostridium rhizosphaerae]MBL4936192.1 cob(I)yrinic acid a,c-diamide adenosyltransferase [Clostridium rhizosphaerae]
MDKLERGYVQIYTGNGKGKTTAAVGQAVRAAGNNLKVYMLQFLKTDPTGELEIAKLIGDKFQIFRFESKKGFFWNLNDEEKVILKKEIDTAYDFAAEVIKNNSCDVFILDEIMGVLSNGILTVDQVAALIDNKPENMELILTGRNVPDLIKDKADLVTEMKEIKHYMNKGVYSREGIEY